MSSTGAGGEKFSYVKLVTDQEDYNLTTGRYWPQIINSVPTNRITIVVSSDDKINQSTSDFNFYADLHQESANLRSIQLDQVILPLTPTINDRNNTMNITLNSVTSDIVLPNGFYSPNSYVNALQSVLSTFWASAIVGGAVLVSYNPAERNITITDITPGGPYNWQFNDSIYYRYGRHVAYFPIGISSDTQTTTSLEMLYTRFYIIRSERLTDSQRSSSLTSSLQPCNIVAIVPIVEYFTENQFNPSAAFPGTSKLINCGTSSPIINTTNMYKSLRIFDISVYDEYGFCLDSIFSDGTFQYECAFFFTGYIY